MQEIFLVQGTKDLQGLFTDKLIIIIIKLKKNKLFGAANNKDVDIEITHCPKIDKKYFFIAKYRIHEPTARNKLAIIIEYFNDLPIKYEL